MAQHLPVHSHYYINKIAPTPLVRVSLSETEPGIWCKLEYLNASGSTKDRIARYILEKAWREARIGPGFTVVEASSGSTSIAMALASAQLGLRFVAVMPEGVSNERVLIIRAYGGEISLTPKALGIRGAIAETERMAQDPKIFLPRQFANLENAQAHAAATAAEILVQIPGGTVDGFALGVGTGGTIAGLYDGFRTSGCQAKPFLARPTSTSPASEAMGGVECCSFSQCIPGVVESVSTIFDPLAMEGLETIEIDEALAMETTRALMRLGFPVGPSSGLNFAAAVVAARRLGPAAQVATVFCDRMERYFTTELFRPFLQ